MKGGRATGRHRMLKKARRRQRFESADTAKTTETVGCSVSRPGDDETRPQGDPPSTTPDVEYR